MLFTELFDMLKRHMQYYYYYCGPHGLIRPTYLLSHLLYNMAKAIIHLALPNTLGAWVKGQYIMLSEHICITLKPHYNWLILPAVHTLLELKD